MTRLIFCAFLLLAGFNVWAGDCREEGDGRISCSAPGFKKLTDTIIDCEAEQQKGVLRLDACTARVNALEAALTAPAPVAPPKPSVKPVVATAVAVMGTAALTSAMLANDMTPAVRVGLGVAGAAAITSAFIIAF